MLTWQRNLLILYGLVSFTFFVKGYYECKFKKNSYGKYFPLNLIGAFVWADAVIFGAFWFLVSAVTFFLDDWLLFLLIVSIFWLVRSVGETIYWFNQQFSRVNRNPVKSIWFHKIFHDDSVWFVYQISWQCLIVVSTIFTLYFAKSWLASL